MSEVNPEDKGTPAPAAATPPVEIEVVDTPTPPEEVAPAPQEDKQPLYFGKFRSLEDAEKAYSEAQRTMHEKAQEAATYRKMLDETRQAPPTPAYPQQHVPQDFDDRFREQLANNPGQTLFGMIRHVAGEMIKERDNANLETVKKFQTFSSRPEFADVAPEVAADLPFANQPIDPVEGLFLRRKIAKLEAALKSGAGTQPVNPQFVEPGNVARRMSNNSIRVELDPDTAKLRNLGTDKTRDLARIIAKQKMQGGTMREMSIDDWEKANA